MLFIDVLASYNSADCVDINKKLSDIALSNSTSHQMVENIYAETRIDAKEWRFFIEELLRSPSNCNVLMNKIND